MNLIKSCLVLLILSFGLPVLSDTSRLRFVAMAGLADSLAQDASKRGSDHQGPFGGTATIDYLVDGQWEVGAEHQRTWSNRSGTAVGLTGVVVKNYFLISHNPVKVEPPLTNKNDVYEFNALTPYVGIAAGIGQASIIDQNVNALGVYGALKGGFEWPMDRGWGLRAEGTAATTLFGSGGVSYISAQTGFYIYL